MSNCRVVAPGASKRVPTKILKHCLPGIFFSKHGQWSLSDISVELFLVLTIAIMANIEVPPGDNIHSYHQTLVTEKCSAPGLIVCAPGVKYVDTHALGVSHYCPGSNPGRGHVRKLPVTSG